MNKSQITVLAITVVLCAGAFAYDSGSDGSDGALVLDAPGEVIYFDPDSFDPVLDPDGDGVYHFTDITITQGTRVLFLESILGHRPLYWLASGNVIVENGSIIDLSGSGRTAGVGGFSGGNPRSSGAGPGGGRWDSLNEIAADASHVSGLAPYGNRFLHPMLGGSGGAGDFSSVGSGGGGAFVLAASGWVSLDGSINAAPFGSLEASRGSGGAVRIVCAELRGEYGMFNLDSGGVPAGRLRLESEIDTSSLNFFHAGDVVRAKPGELFIPNPIRIVAVDSEAISETPGSNRTNADATITNPGESTISVEANGVPVGTVVTISIWNESLTEPLLVSTTPLAGSDDSFTTATATVHLPSGKNLMIAEADWSGNP